MKLYFAGAEAFTELMKEIDIKSPLFSYYYLDERENLKKFDDIFLDSGGFTARVRREKIYVEEYIGFVKAIEKELTHYANLDTADQEKSEENLKKMEKEGLNPMPVWHSGWSQDLLKNYLNSYDYVALGGIAGSTFDTEKKFKEIVRFANLEGNAKLHLFGMTDPHILSIVKDKIYSADSTSWLNGGRYGHFFYFDGERMKQLSPQQFEKKYGKAFNQVNYHQRNKWNLLHWKKFSNYLGSEKT